MIYDIYIAGFNRRLKFLGETSVYHMYVHVCHAYIYNIIYVSGVIYIYIYLSSIAMVT